jgi:molybdopterin molybdotransferase
MLTVDQALAEVLARAAPRPPERLALAEALGCFLAEDVAADCDMPPFDKALVDGFAVRSADLLGGRVRLRIVEEVPAGKTPTHSLGPGETAAIMTGAPLPVGADAVVMLEQSETNGETVELTPSAPVVPGLNRLSRGREMRTGDVVLQRGRRLTPARLGLLATVGRSHVDVVPPPRLTVVPTGDELVEPGFEPGPGQIRNSNAMMLQALARVEGAIAHTSAIAPDEPERLREILGRGLEADVLLITGGVSAGKRDFVPTTLAELGVSPVFHKVRLKPGKPLLFGIGPARGVKGRATLVFGLPGNPVSGLVGFLLFVRPALAVLAGGTPAQLPATNLGRLARPFTHRGDRPTYHPSLLRRHATDLPEIEPLDWAGSADLRTVAGAGGFAIFPAGDREYEAGEAVAYLPLDPD